MGRFLRANDRYAQLRGARCGDELVGRSLRACMSDQSARERLATARRVLITGRSVVVRTMFGGVYFQGVVRPLSRREVPAMFHPAAVLISFTSPERGLQGVDAGSWSQCPDPGVLAALSPGQIDLLSLLGAGRTAIEAAAELDMPPESVALHVMAMETRLGVRGPEALGLVARQAGLGYVEDDAL